MPDQTRRDGSAAKWVLILSKGLQESITQCLDKDLVTTAETVGGLQQGTEFASTGLRTMAFAMRSLELEEFEQLKAEANNANEEFSTMLERDLRLLAPVSIEDSIDPRVPAAVQQLVMRQTAASSSVLSRGCLLTGVEHQDLDDYWRSGVFDVFTPHPCKALGTGSGIDGVGSREMCWHLQC